MRVSEDTPSASVSAIDRNASKRWSGKQKAGDPYLPEHEMTNAYTFQYCSALVPPRTHQALKPLVLLERLATPPEETLTLHASVVGLWAFDDADQYTLPIKSSVKG